MQEAERIIFADQARQRSEGYWLLSKLFLELPTPDRLLALKAAVGPLREIESPLQRSIANLLQAIEQAFNAPDETAAEFTRRLIVVPKESQEPLPFESHVRENRLPGEATESIYQLMCSSGYADLDLEALTPDHLGIELRLMALLCHDEFEAWQNNDLETAVTSLRHQNLLLGEHLAQWVPDYCQALAERSGTGYIGAVAHLARQSLIEDKEVLVDISSRLDVFLNATIQ